MCKFLAPPGLLCSNSPCPATLLPSCAIPSYTVLLDRWIKLEGDHSGLPIAVSLNTMRLASCCCFIKNFASILQQWPTSANRCCLLLLCSLLVLEEEDLDSVKWDN